MNRTLIFLLGVLAVVLLSLVCSCNVQADIQARTESALQQTHPWATVAADGRDVLVSGIAPSAAQEAAALEAVNLEGVLDIDSAVRVHALSPLDVIPVRAALRDTSLAWVTAAAEDRTLVLGGLSGTAGDRDLAEGVVEPLWPFGPIDNRIDVARTDAERAAVACREAIDGLRREGTVRFESGSAQLVAESLPLLDRIAAEMLGCPDATLRIEAHSDNTGDAQMNLNLSEQRAASVLEYLVSAGVSADGVRSSGFGESRPVASNETESGRALNRRVEFNVTVDA